MDHLNSQPYGTTTTESSPLSRPVKQAEAGQVWASHPNQVSYTTNSAQDNVRLWRNLVDGLDGNIFYAAGQLSKEILADADGRRTELFKDGNGRVILQRKVAGYGGPARKDFDTYSVYAPAGYLQYTVPPEALKKMDAAGEWAVIDMRPGFAAQWLYEYTYDDRGRLVERRFPAAAPVYLVYDKADRPILVQDGNHRAAKQWLFTKYDAQNRPVVSGLYHYDSQSPTLRQDLQGLANTTTFTAEFESRASTGYTTTNTFPAIQDGNNGAVVLSMAFFDDYDLDQNTTSDYTYAAQVGQLTPMPEQPTGPVIYMPDEPYDSPRSPTASLVTKPTSEPVATTQLRGLQTVTKTRVVKANGQYGSWLTTALFYDEYSNLIQKQSSNLLQTGSALGDVTTIVYRQNGFVPQVIRTLKTQQTAALNGNISPTVSVRNRFSYDASGRLLQTWQQHQWKNTWEPEVLVTNNTYTGLGELTQKQLHSRDGAKYLQKVDFLYNLHGQLKSINNSNNLLYDNPDNDLFALNIVREETESYGVVSRYDGGISAINWATHNAAQTNQPERQRRYYFLYDELGRMTEAVYQARPAPWNGWSSYEQGAYNEKITEYDANGNIRSLQRYTQTNASASPTLLDNLSFTYTGNQHTKVDDTGDVTRGFKDARTTQEYAYDPNGSITRDDNKGVVYTYNTLNKVEKQTVGAGVLTYTYDASGTLLMRETAYSGATTKTEYYIDGLVYQAGGTSYAGLVSIPTPEGRAMVAKPTDERLTYEYHLRDHLGNLRVAFRAQAGTEELRLTMEPTADEEGSYPRFRNVASTRTTTRYFQGVAAASVSSYQPGPSNRIPVAHGDQIQVKVYYATPAGAQYSGGGSEAITTSSRPNLSTMLAVAPALLPVPSSAHTEGKSGRKFAPGVQVSLTGVLSALVAKKDPVRPPVTDFPMGFVQDAYIAWTLLTEEGETISTGRQVVPVRDLQNWWRQDLSISVDLSSVESRNGYLKVELLNDGVQSVFFDDLTITKPEDKALVTQENHYYPLGMALSGVAVNTNPVLDLSKEQFNNGSSLQDELLGTEGGVYSTFFRTYDPTTGRFTGVDPLADVTAAWTPYQFALGDPAAANDPTGALTSYSGWASLIRAALRGDAEEGYYTDGGSGGGGAGGKPGFVSREFGFEGMTLGVRDGQLGHYTFSNQSDSFLSSNKDGSKNVGNVNVGAQFHSFATIILSSTILFSVSAQNGSDDPSRFNDPNRNPRQDRQLSPQEIERLKRNGWDHSDKGPRGGRKDLYKDKKNNVYEKPKGGGPGYGEPIGVNLEHLDNFSKVGLGVSAGIILYEVIKWGAAVILAPETGGASLGAAAALP